MYGDMKKRLLMARVVNKRLLYVTNIPMIMGDINILRSNIYFGQFGKIERIHLGMQGKQSQLCSLFVLYRDQSACEEAIKLLDDSIIECITNKKLVSYKITCTYGTSKYCLNFIEGRACHYSSCTFFHELASKSLSLNKSDLSINYDSINSEYTRVTKKLHDFKSINENKIVLNTYVNKSLADIFDTKTEIYDHKIYINYSVDDWNPIE